jgi:hypothetical protein
MRGRRVIPGDARNLKMKGKEFAGGKGLRQALHFEQKDTELEDDLPGMCKDYFR